MATQDDLEKAQVHLTEAALTLAGAADSSQDEDASQMVGIIQLIAAAQRRLASLARSLQCEK